MLLAQSGHLKILVAFFSSKTQLGVCAIHSFIQEMFTECQVNASEWCSLHLGSLVAQMSLPLWNTQSSW